MAWELDDNTRGALHFAGVGLLIVLVLKGALIGMDLLMAPGSDASEQILAPFRNGYWIGTGTLVPEPLSRADRLLKAVVLSIGFAFGLAALAGFFGGRERLSVALRVGRSAVVILLVWSFIGAVVIPETSVRMTSEGLLVTERTQLFGVLPVPFTAFGRVISATDVEEVFLAQDEPAGRTGLLVLTGSTPIRLGTADKDAADDASAELLWL